MKDLGLPLPQAYSHKTLRRTKQRPHCSNVIQSISSWNRELPTTPMDPYQRDAHQEGRSPEGAGPEEVEGPHKEESSSSGDQSSLEALVGAGPEHLGTGLWGVGVVPVGQAQLPGSQAVVVMGALGQEGQCLVAAAATAAAASGAAPAKNKSGERLPVYSQRR